MSTLWTPGGERPIRREPAGGEPGRPGGPGEPGSGDTAPGDPGEPTPEELEARMAQLQEQLARTPAHQVVANHAFGLFELAALHLSRQPPQLDQARVAIDAMAALVDGLGERLGEHADELSDGLAQLRMAYVQIHGAQSAGNGVSGQAPAEAADDPGGEADQAAGQEHPAPPDGG